MARTGHDFLESLQNHGRWQMADGLAHLFARLDRNPQQPSAISPQPLAISH